MFNDVSQTTQWYVVKKKVKLKDRKLYNTNLLFGYSYINSGYCNSVIDISCIRNAALRK